LTAGFLTALGLTIADVAGGDPSRTAMHWCAALAAVASLALFTLILRVFGIKLGGLVIGQDQRLSTSKLQALLWTYLLLWMLLAILIANWIGAPGGFNNLINQDLPEEYLILLGGPFAAAIASKAIVSGKVENGTLSKTEGTPHPDRKKRAKQRVGEAFGNDEGNTDLGDTQYLLFNLLAIGYVIGGFVTDPSGGVPSIPSVLVGLTSVSAATYVSKKAISSEIPVLNGVFPTSGPPGTPVRVMGRYLLVPYDGEGDSFEEVFVSFGEREAQVLGVEKEEDHLAAADGDVEHLPRHETTGDDRLWVEVPDLDPAKVEVTVSNHKGVATKDHVVFEVTSKKRSRT
jgi:hypothetical protein